MAADSIGHHGGHRHAHLRRGAALAQTARVAAGAPRRNLSPADSAIIRWVEQDKEAALVASLARRFTALVRSCGALQPMRPTAPVAELEAWLAEAKACGVGAVETFTAGLEVDGAAVRAALTETWSSGQAEGQVNRLKLQKRQSYGRAGFDLLRRRVLMAA